MSNQKGLMQNFDVTVDKQPDTWTYKRADEQTWQKLYTAWQYVRDVMIQ